MRARLLRAWPNLSHYFGLHPWDLERLTVGEIGAYLDWLADLKRQHDEAERAARRR